MRARDAAHASRDFGRVSLVGVPVTWTPAKSMRYEPPAINFHPEKHPTENHKGEGSRPSLPFTAPIPTGCDVLWHFRPRECSLLRTLKHCPGPPDAIKARGASLGFHSASACRGRHAYTTAPS